MFETREIVYTADDYGASTSDLKFQDITAATFSSRCVCVCVCVCVCMCSCVCVFVCVCVAGIDLLLRVGR